MNEFTTYKIIEFIIFSLYLIFIFLAIQIWFLWKDIDKNELKVTTFINESFFKKNCFYVFSFTVFFIIHELLEGTGLPNAAVYFEFLEMLGFSSIVLLTYDWYSILKTATNKKSLPLELTCFTK